MDLEQELYLVGKNIKRDAPSWGVDLDNPANEFTLWTVSSAPIQFGSWR